MSANYDICTCALTSAGKCPACVAADTKRLLRAMHPLTIPELDVLDAALAFAKSGEGHSGPAANRLHVAAMKLVKK